MRTILSAMIALAVAASADEVTSTSKTQAAAPKVGFAHWSRLLDEYQKSADRGKELERRRADANREIAEREKGVERLGDELGLLKKDTEVYFAKRKELMSATSSLRLLKERTRAVLAQREAQFNAELFRDIRSAVQRFAKDNGYIAIFRLEEDPSLIEDPEIQAYKMNTLSLFYSDPGADVTDDIVEMLNREYGRRSTAKQKPSARPTANPTPKHPPPQVAPNRQPDEKPQPDGAAEPAAARVVPTQGDPRPPTVAGNDTTALLQQLLEQNRALNERITTLAATLDSNLSALAEEISEVDQRTSAMDLGYVAEREAQVTGSVSGRVLWDGKGLAGCRVKLVRMRQGNSLDALATLFDVGVKPENRRAEFVVTADEGGVFNFETIPTGPYKLHWRPAKASNWVRRIREKPDVVVQPGTLVYCTDVETNIRTLN